MVTARIENPLNIERVTSSVQSQFKHILSQVFERNAFQKPARIVFIDGRNIRFESSDRDITILMNAAPPSAKSVIDTHEQVILSAVGIPSMMQGGNSAYIAFKDENGIDLAYYDKKHADLYVPYDVLALSSDAAYVYFESLLDIVVKDLQHQEAQRFMWGGENHEAVEAQLKELVKGQQAVSVRDLEQHLRNEQEAEEKYRNRLRRSIAQIQQYMKQLDDAREGNTTLDAKIAQEFAVVQKNPDVKYIEVRENKFIIHTNPIIGYASNGKYYYFGNYRIEYELGRTGVNFFGGTPRKGYWSDNDPHPHVDGRSGQPCLGNTSEAIAQLGASHEYAALITVAIEFLKATNVDDSAGNKVTRWDEYDVEKGDTKKNLRAKREAKAVRPVFEPPVEEVSETPMERCYQTGNLYPVDEMIGVFIECDEDHNLNNYQRVHQDNLSVNYTYHDEIQEYIHDNAEVWN